MDQPSAKPDELDALRIKRLIALRQAAYRSRSYAVIAVGGCVGTASESVYLAVIHLRSSGIIWAILYFLAAALFLAGAVFFAKLTMRYHRQAKESALSALTTPPDFSKLSDGSQFARNLENIE